MSKLTYLLACFNLDCANYARLVFSPTPKRHCTECGRDLWQSDSVLEPDTNLPAIFEN